jgi:glycosyltransferase involved in cell wall biosynthesis
MPPPLAAVSPPAPNARIVFIVSEDWFFASHFLGFAAAARAAGLEPVVVTRVGRHRGVLEAQGCRVVAVPIARRAFGPFAVVRALLQYRAILRAETPAIVHCIALKSVVIGGFAARLAGVRALVLAPTGLGFFWTASGARALAGRIGVRIAVAVLALGKGARFLFENRDDPRALGLDADDRKRVSLVGGAGVSGLEFSQQPAPQGDLVRVAAVARMLRSKGIVESVEAVRQARAAGANIALDLWGEPDPSNLDSITIDEISALTGQPGIVWHGRTEDVAGVWRDSHIAILLSYREGLPRSLVEAAASGRPIVTTDAPGCRAVVDDGEQGYLVPPRNAQAAAAALVKLANDPAARQRMGANARRRFEAQFSSDIVNARVEALYRACLDQSVR